MKRRVHVPFAALITLLLIGTAGKILAVEEVTDKRTVAVASFENTMKKDELDWIGTGFAETITTKLAHVRGLIVVERRQIQAALKEMELGQSGLVDPKTAQQAGKLLGAQYMLIGSFQKFDASSGSRLMVNCRMMMVESAQIFETFMIRGVWDDMFDLQEQLAIKVCSILEVPLSDEERADIAKNETSSLSAYEYFYRAKHVTDINEKISLYKKALESDPQYVFALTNLGSIYYVKFLSGEEEMLKQAEQMCSKAIDADPLHADTHYVIASVYEKMGRKNEAVTHLRAFLELKPDDSRARRAKRRLKELD